MRTYGRLPPDENGYRQWVEVNSANLATDDNVWLTTLAQNLKLITGESPFFANFGLPSEQAIIMQIVPQYHVNLIQQRFAQYFASLIITRVPGPGNPVWRVNVLTRYGARIQTDVPT